MSLYLAVDESEGSVRVLGVFSSLELAKLCIEGDGPKLPWMPVQGIGRRWWEIGAGAEQAIFEIELDKPL